MTEPAASVFTQAPADESAACDGAPRINGPFPALLRGVNARGEQFVSETELDDLSAVDFKLRLREPLEQGAKLFAVVRLYKALVAIQGIVLKAEPMEDGLSCLRVSILRNRFLS